MRLANAAAYAGLGIDIGPDGETLSDDPDVQDHFATWNPARVIREVEAKRAILAAYQPSGKGVAYTLEAGLEFAVRALAAAWSDHPDYRAEWKPDG